MTTSIKGGSSKFIESRFIFDGQNAPIPSKILEKHLTQDQHPIFNFIQGTFDKMVAFIKPFYSITTERIMQNIKGVVFSKWQFQLPEEEIQKNVAQEQEFIRMSHYLLGDKDKARPSSRQSISLKSSIRRSKIQQSDLYKVKYNRSMYFVNQDRFMFFWGPFTTIILTHLISNHPFATQQTPNQTMISQNSDVNVIAGGIIHLLSMVLISFSMFVYFKVLQSSQVHSLFQHLNLSSYVGLLSIVFSIICSSSIDYLIIPFALIYILGCSYLHVNAYNQALKPNMFELIGLGLVIMFFYTSAGYMFYHYYHMPAGAISNGTQKGNNHYFMGIGKSGFLHQRSYEDIN